MAPGEGLASVQALRRALISQLLRLTILIDVLTNLDSVLRMLFEFPRSDVDSWQTRPPTGLSPPRNSRHINHSHCKLFGKDNTH